MRFCVRLAHLVCGVSFDPRLAAGEDRRGERAGGIGEAFYRDVERAEDAQVHVGHALLAVAEVVVVLEAEVGTASHQGRKVARGVRGARP